MQKVQCPECDEVVKVPEDSKTVRCPACGTKIGSKASRAEPADEDDPDDYEEKRERKRKKKKSGKSKRGSGRPAGVLPLAVLGPICAALTIWAPFSGIGTALSMLFGTLVLLVAFLVVGIALHRDPEWQDEVTSPLVRFIPVLAVVVFIRATLANPRRFAAWMILALIGLVTVTMGITAQAVWKTMEEGPGRHGQGKPADSEPKAGGEQRPGANPNAPPAQPAPTPPAPPDPSVAADKAITDALAGLDKPEDFARGGAVADLGRMTPKEDRRAEVVKRLTELVTVPQQSVRVEAIKALGVWGTKDDVPTLVRALDHEDGATRRTAAQAVRRFRDDRAVPALVRHLGDVHCTGESAKALIDVGSAAERSVIPALASADVTEQGAAIDVLKEIGTVDSVPALRKVVSDKSFWATKATEALKSINARSKKKK